MTIGSTRILTDVSVDVPVGKITGLLGPNGAGKTTLLRAMCGTLMPTKGKVRLNGRNIHRIGPKDRAKVIAYVEQHQHADVDLTVRQVVALGRIPHSNQWTTKGEETSAIIDKSLQTVKLAHLADRTWNGLSGGERQRVHLARALAQEPQILGLDEPTNHLDLNNQISFLNLIRDLGLTTIIVIHDLDMAAAYCDEVVILDQGLRIDGGTTRSTLTSQHMADVFRVEANTQEDDRLRVLWSGTTD
ncbi:ABC transporter ATP-binding protein [Stomatohabitans albus]|uniref:ABC transporter ATP-binding protein n=1 Tax=Stomatohabitans albus TaxID=3110766 RepID=UPI00300C1337